MRQVNKLYKPLLQACNPTNMEMVSGLLWERTLIRNVYTVLELIAVGFAFAAAWFWLRSEQSVAPDLTLNTLTALQPWLENIAYQNHQAALCAGISAAAQGLSVLAIRAGLY
jgi:hypothetical protein